jgi:ABC-type uncharacterized transport system ATPase subunit
VQVAPEWLATAPASIALTTPTGSRIRLEPDADAAALLDRIREHAEVRDFAVEAPTLSELFLAATGTDVRSGDAQTELEPTGGMR